MIASEVFHVRRIPLIAVPVFLLTVCMAGSTHSRFTDSHQIPDNIFTTAGLFPLQTIPLSSLDAGDMVMDSTWEWHHRPGADYAGTGTIKPIVWIVAGKDHYRELYGDYAYMDYGGSYYQGVAVMLVAQEVIAKRPFDSSSNNWMESNRIRPWLKSKLYDDTFPDSFKMAVLQTNIPNKLFDSSHSHITVDRVFVLSETELGSTSGLEIGTVVEYFQDATDGIRKAKLGETEVNYWTRSPCEESTNLVRYVKQDGSISQLAASTNTCGYRPVLSLDGDIRVKSDPVDGVYEIAWIQP